MIRVSPGYFAVLMIYMVSVSEDIKRLLANLTKAENRFVSFERCFFFMSIPPEEGYTQMREMKQHFKMLVETEPEKKDRTFISKNSRRDWPMSGNLDFLNYSVKYRPELDYVLQNITFSLKSGEKLGILGRTGAGKSTLISSIFRYFNQYDGKILYDGVSIKNIDIQQLRRSITTIPQDPILFNTSLKRNLDPSEHHTRAEIEKVLEDVGLWEKFKDSHGIEHMIDVGGSNLSQGVKQLICFGRALLEKNKLILMDEATASIDSVTELKIQQLIKEKFSESTILMIAHKLTTVMDCDKILILDHGKIVEFGYLQELKVKQGSLLSKLLKNADLIKEYF